MTKEEIQIQKSRMIRNLVEAGLAEWLFKRSIESLEELMNLTDGTDQELDVKQARSILVGALGKFGRRPAVRDGKPTSILTDPPQTHEKSAPVLWLSDDGFDRNPPECPLLLDDEGSPVNHAVEVEGPDFRGNWITKNGAHVCVERWNADINGWTGYDAAGSTMWNPDGTHQFNELTLVERIRPGAMYKKLF